MVQFLELEGLFSEYLKLSKEFDGFEIPPTSLVSSWTATSKRVTLEPAAFCYLKLPNTTTFSRLPTLRTTFGTTALRLRAPEKRKPGRKRRERERVTREKEIVGVAAGKPKPPHLFDLSVLVIIVFPASPTTTKGQNHCCCCRVDCWPERRKPLPELLVLFIA